MNLAERVLKVGESFDRAGIAWAIGGAIALAYATEEPRTTRDIDVNVFVPASDVDRVFGCLPDGVNHGHQDRHEVLVHDQVRLWWDDTPVDVFFAAAAFHLEVATRCRRVPFGTGHIMILSPEDLAVFKAMFDRPKDWIDITEMVRSGTLERDLAAERLAEIIGAKDERIDRLRALE